MKVPPPTKNTLPFFVLLLFSSIILSSISSAEITINNLNNLTTYQSSTPKVQIQVSNYCRATISSDAKVVRVFQPNDFPDTISTWEWSDQRPGLHSLKIIAVCSHIRFYQFLYLYTILNSNDIEGSEWGLQTLSSVASTIIYDEHYENSNLLSTQYYCHKKLKYRILVDAPSIRLSGHSVPISIHLMKINDKKDESLLKMNVRVNLYVHCNTDLGLVKTSPVENLVILRRGVGLIIIDAIHLTTSSCTIEAKLYKKKNHSCLVKATVLEQQQHQPFIAAITTTTQTQTNSNSVYLPKDITESIQIPSGMIIYLHKDGLKINITGYFDICDSSIIIVSPNSSITIINGELRIGLKCNTATTAAVTNTHRSSMITTADPTLHWGGIEIFGTLKLYSVYIIQSTGSNDDDDDDDDDGSQNEHCSNVRIVLNTHNNGTLLLDHSYLLGGNHKKIQEPIILPRGIVGINVKLINISYSILSSLSVGINVKNSNLLIHDSTFMNFYGLSEDHDGMYIVGGRTIIKDTTVSGAKDDCIDSGTGPGGNIQILNSFVEYCMHEGIAISDNGWGTSKLIQIDNSIVSHCQQGIELGFSTHLLLLTIKNVTFRTNDIGLRIGDNYNWAKYNGHVKCINCIFQNNIYKDILKLDPKTYTTIPNRLQLIDSIVPTEKISKNYHDNYDHNNVGISLELQRDGKAVQFVFDNKFDSIASMEWQVAELCSGTILQCTFDEYKQIVNAHTKDTSITTFLKKNHPEIHLLILWSNVPNDISVDINTLLLSGQTGLTILSQYNVSSLMNEFNDENFFNHFYKSNPYTIWERNNNGELINVPMSKHKGINAFHVYLLLDQNPKYVYIQKKGLVSKNIYHIKHQLRSWLSGQFQIHTSQTVNEAKLDYKFLFNKNLPSYQKIEQILKHLSMKQQQLQPPIQMWWPPESDPVYPSTEVNITVIKPFKNQIIYNSTLYIQWELAMKNIDILNHWKKEFHENKDHSSSNRPFPCIVVSSNDGFGDDDNVNDDYDNNKDDYDNDDENTIIQQNNCQYDAFPSFHHLLPGKYILKIWLISDSKESKRSAVDVKERLNRIILTSPTYVPFEIRKKSILYDLVVPTNANVVIGASLQAEWPIIEMNPNKNKLIIDTYGKELSNIIINPNYNDEWENILRSSMHGRHLPIILTVPFNIEWYVANVSIHEIGSLYTMNEASWNVVNDGATKQCANIKDNSKNIRNIFCKKKTNDSNRKPRPNLLKEDGNPTHSASILSMIPSISTLSKTFVAVGKSFDKLTIWDGNHRALAYYSATVENTISRLGMDDQSNIPGCSIILKNDNKDGKAERIYTLYAGIAESWEKGFVCH